MATKQSLLQCLDKTVDWLLKNGAKQIVIAGHIGRPSRKATERQAGLISDFYDTKLSTKNLLPALEKILGQKIAFSDELTVDEESSIVLLENLRFWPEEKKNDPDFAQKLSKLADVYVDDAFGNAHRAHASMVGITSFLPYAAGLHLEEEVEVLSKLLDKPKKPFVAIVGGAKIETKVPVIENLSKTADKILVGGRVAVEITNGKVGVPDNAIIAGMLEHSYDINDEAIRKFESVISTAKTVVWNGPVGFFEEGHKKGTVSVAEAIVKSGAYSVIGGGETTEFLASCGLLSKFSFVSCGGGAMLEFLSGKKLPAIEAFEGKWF